MEIRTVSEALDLEYSVAPILGRQQSRGVLFDVTKAKELEVTLLTEKAKIRQELQEIFKPRFINKGEFTPKKSRQKDGIKAGCTYTKIQLQEYNPSSRQQTIDRLCKEFGWNPTEFTDKGNIEFDEDIIESLPFKEMKPLKDYYIINKRLGQLVDGKKAWLKEVKDDGRIYGSIMQSGTITGRMSHFCVPMDTKALTRSGWKTYDELIIGEEILAYDPITHTKKWTPLENKNKFNNAEVGRLFCGRRNFRCTANHRWVVKNKDYYLRDRMNPRRRCAGKYNFKEAVEIGGTHAILINAPYDNQNIGGEFKLINQKYDYNYFNELLKMNQPELEAFLNGFLLADGCFRKSNRHKSSWTFAQAEGDIFDLLLTASYLVSDKRIGCNIKNIPTKTQRQGHNVTLTQTSTLRNRKSMRWEWESTEDVWCPQTKYGTWIMRQGNEITITGNSPNMSQAPSNDKPYGKECRALFKVPPDKVMIGCDADSLEMRICAGYMKRLDGGRFINTVLKGHKEDNTDMHTLNMYAYGLEAIEGGRDCAKTAFYASLYGCKDPKLGLILQQWGVDLEVYVPDFKNQFRKLKEWAIKKNTGFSDNFLKCLLGGKEARRRYGEQMPTLPKLINDIQETWKKNGFLKGLDGRKLYPRNEHSACNVLFQSAGAIIMKKALAIADYMLDNDISSHGKYEFILNVHDEWQLEVDNDKECIEYISWVLPEAIVRAGQYFNFACPMAGNVKLGKNWSECH